MAVGGEAPAWFDAPEYRLEGPLKVTGRAPYTADLHRAGTLWARFVASPHPYARIVAIDTLAARAVPGVRAVLTAADIGHVRYGRILADCPVLAWDCVLFVGDRVAAVAAETREAAEEAAALVQVEYEELPGIFDAEAALAPEAPILHPAGATYRHRPGPRWARPHENLQGYRLITKGDPDIEPLFAQAAYVVEDVLTTERQHQGFIEPHACLVWIEPDGTVQVRSTNKSPFALRQELTEVTGLASDQIVVENVFIGGDFGGKGRSFDEYACYFLARATGRPVKAVFTYADELGAGNPRNSGKFYVRTGLTAEGRILVHEARTYYDDGAYAAGRPLPGPILDGWSTLEPYNVPNARLETFMAYTNQVPGGQMRAPGSAHTGFVGEVHVDHMAQVVGMDPLAFRLLNAIRPGDTDPTGARIREARAAELLETIRKETAWGQPLPPNHGRGLAIRSRHVGQGWSDVLFRLLADGSVEAVHGTPDQGGGAGNVVQRVAARVLGIAPERIHVRYGSTAERIFSPGAGSSRTTHVLGQATIGGATELRDKLEELAAEVMGWPAGHVHLDSDRFIVPDASGGTLESAPFDVVTQRIARTGTVEAFGSYDSAEHHGEEGGDYNYCVFMIEVAVDRETGEVRPVDAVIAVDVGTIVNPLGHQGQIDGGFIFGLGNGLMEEVVLQDGRVVTLSLGDYKLPTQMDVPPLRTIRVPTPIGPGPFGAKSIGETVNNAVAPALANAISAALGGLPVRTMPVTAERIRDALTARR